MVIDKPKSDDLKVVSKDVKAKVKKVEKLQNIDSAVIASQALRAEREPTWKQKAAFSHLVANNGTVKAAMRVAGYSEKALKNPHQLTRSRGFRSLMRDAGLDESLVVSSLKTDIIKGGSAPSQGRIRELTLAARMLGMIQNGNPTQTNVTINNQLPEPDKRRIIDIL